MPCLHGGHDGFDFNRPRRGIAKANLQPRYPRLKVNVFRQLDHRHDRNPGCAWRRGEIHPPGRRKPRFVFCRPFQIWLGFGGKLRREPFHPDISHGAFRHIDLRRNDCGVRLCDIQHPSIRLGYRQRFAAFQFPVIRIRCEKNSERIAVRHIFK